MFRISLAVFYRNDRIATELFLVLFLHYFCFCLSHPLWISQQQSHSLLPSRCYSPFPFPQWPVLHPTCHNLINLYSCSLPLFAYDWKVKALQTACPSDDRFIWTFTSLHPTQLFSFGHWDTIIPQFFGTCSSSQESLNQFFALYYLNFSVLMQWWWQGLCCIFGRV